MGLFTIFHWARKTESAQPRVTRDMQVKVFIEEVIKYINKRIYRPHAELTTLSFLDRSSPTAAQKATAAVQTFFQETQGQLETYKNLIAALRPQERFWQNAREKSIAVLQSLMKDCGQFETNAAYYALPSQKEAARNFLNKTVKGYLAALQLFLDANNVY